MVIAIAVALCPSVILLDEPTSALDPDSVKLTEAVLKECGSACVWVSHDPTQPKRVGGRVLELPSGECWAGLTFVSIPDTHPDTLPAANKTFCLLMRSEVNDITTQLANDPIHSYPDAILVDYTTMH